jgi:uncharacterized ion transporter superfamily protein YfcC
LVINVAGIFWVLRYAARIRKNPETSPVHRTDSYWREKEQIDPGSLDYRTPVSAWIAFFILLAGMGVFAVIEPASTLRVGNRSITFWFLPVATVLFAISSDHSSQVGTFFVLNLLLFTILYLIRCHGIWLAKGIATCFCHGDICRHRHAGCQWTLVLEGMRDILSAAVVVGLAGGILVILEDGRVIDSLLNNVASSMQEFGKLATVSMMYLIQTLINIVMPSGSAKAALTMPIMSQFLT